MYVTAVIPARLASTRLPEKPLALIAGKPMIEHVYRQAKKARGVDRVVIATDHQKIVQAVQSFGGEVVLTDPELQSGTDRVGEVARQALEGKGAGSDDIYINVQGDEPMVAPQNIEAALALVTSGRYPIGTCASEFLDAAALENPNVVKALVAESGQAIYFSRYPIPYSRVKNPTDAALKVATSFAALPMAPLQHQGIYVYRRESLLKFCALPRTKMELAESLEQLRALYFGIPMGVALVTEPSIGVDTPEDLESVRRLLEK